MKTFVSFFSIAIFLLVLWRCNPLLERKDDRGYNPEQVTKDIEAEKKSIAENLRDWSDNIDRRIKALDEQISKANDKTRKSLRDLQARLRKEKNKVDRSLKDIEKSTDKTWADVKKRSSEVLTDAKIEAQKIEERVEDLID